jgi:xanthine dehydrogenase molybdopterin-binding subunit B
VAEVDVDPETGEVKVPQVWIAHDVGRALNPLLAEGQTEGSVYMGLGEVLMEEQVFRKGLHKIPSMLEYKSPTTLETPEIHTILVETDDPEGPFGAKEAGQGPLLPVIPAVANAVYNAVGVAVAQRRREIGILRSLGAGRRRVVALFALEAVIVAIATVSSSSSPRSAPNGEPSRSAAIRMLESRMSISR